MRATVRHAIPVVAVVVALAVGSRWRGVAAVALFLPMLPAIAWRYDNDTGAFLILAVLFVMTVLIMGLLIALMALHR